MPRLIVERPDQPSLTVEVCDGLTIGRDETNTIILTDSKASRRHARLSINEEGDYKITDLKSTHGTYLNGAPVTTSTLYDGDRIRIGDLFLRYIDSGEASQFIHVKPTNPEPSRYAADDNAARKLRIFYEVARAVSQSEDTSTLLGRMLEAILNVLGCERGVVGLCEPGHGSDNLRRIVRLSAPESEGEIIISRFLIEAMLVRREGVIACDPIRSGTMRKQKILSAMGVPLLFGPRLLGLIYVDDRGGLRRFTEQDLDFLNALAHITAAAVDSAERYQRAAVAAEVLSTEMPMGELIGESPPMRRLKTEIKKFATSPSAHVLIRGESGTGKELVARTLHALSPRSERPLVTLNCAAMPETMIESELFGHVKGAFTGAVSDKRGKFVLADKSTLFLDEIGDLSLSAQAKVLRAVQQGEVQPLGSEKTLRVDVRILSATHKNLDAEVEAGRFREDLLYRLRILDLTVPPLRERAEDIPLLARIFLAAAAMRMGKRIAGFTPRALSALTRYRFPGNVRELQNEAERASIVVDEGEGGEEVVVDIDDLSARISGARASLPQIPAQTLEERYAELEPTEKALVEEALRVAKGNRTEAGRLLGISRVMMRARMKRFEIEDDEPE